jgi:hypothetical protein
MCAGELRGAGPVPGHNARLSLDKGRVHRAICIFAGHKSVPVVNQFISTMYYEQHFLSVKMYTGIHSCSIQTLKKTRFRIKKS